MVTNDRYMSELCAVLSVVIKCYPQCVRQTRILELGTFHSGILSRQRCPVSIVRNRHGYGIERN